jgi:hypothetical protein
MEFLLENSLMLSLVLIVLAWIPNLSVLNDSIFQLCPDWFMVQIIQVLELPLSAFCSILVNFDPL